MRKIAVWGKKIAVLLAAMLILALAMVAASSLGRFRVACEDISQKVLRLHVLANSDRDEDQALKLLVRDAILEESGELFGASENKAEAMKIAADHLDELETAARQVLRDHGCHDEVAVELAEVYFNTRTYGGVTMPAGYYDALQIKIGAAAGHNWWCVLFPSLCIPCATTVELDDVLTPEELELVERSGYDVRFKVVEWYEYVAGWFH